jgi:hypothetical protein
MSEDAVEFYLGEWSVGDEYPYPIFVFTEKEYSSTTGKIEKVLPDLSAKYTAIKFCSRHQNNRTDIDDHAGDDFYTNLTIDGDNIAHLVWPAHTKTGRYYARLEFERQDNAKKFHARGIILTYDIAHKMPGSYGNV